LGKKKRQKKKALKRGAPSCFMQKKNKGMGSGLEQGQEKDPNLKTEGKEEKERQKRATEKRVFLGKCKKRNLLGLSTQQREGGLRAKKGRGGGICIDRDLSFTLVKWGKEGTIRILQKKNESGKGAGRVL